MFKSSGRNVLISFAAGVLLSSTSVLAVAADDDNTYHLLDKSGNVVMSGKHGCVDSKLANAPSKPLPECGDIVDDDGDGVNNDKDHCPGTPAGVQVDDKGCPIDSDGDGVPDYLDKCPRDSARAISKGVDAEGCPIDSDKDGVPDYRDRCPGTPFGAKVDADGCALFVGDKVVSLVGDVTFAFGKWSLSSQGKASLDGVINNIVSQSNLVRGVEVEGHTDSVGSAKYNMKLSQRRANSVRDYMVSKGVAAGLIKAIGKGEENPIADNKTKVGRAKNRRVEIKIDTAQ